MVIVIIFVLWLLALTLVIALGIAAKAGDAADVRRRHTLVLRRLGQLSFRAQAARARAKRRPPPPLA